MLHRTTIELDNGKLTKARRILGTKGIRDTVERALDAVLAQEARRQAVAQLRAMDGLELNDSRVMAAAWR